jgi:hypothetical protein
VMAGDDSLKVAGAALVAMLGAITVIKALN